MRILLVNKYWRRQGGVEEYCFLLKRVLEARGHEVVPFSQLEEGTLETEWSRYFVPPVDPTAGGVVDRTKAMRRLVLGDETTKAVGQLLDDHRIDAAHVVHTYHQLGPMFMKELARRDVPTILSVHDYKLCCPSYRLLDDSTGKICTRCLDDPRQKVTAPALTRCWKGSRAAGVMLGMEAAAVQIRKPYHAARRVMVSHQLMRRCAIAGGLDPERIRIVPNFWPSRLHGEHRPEGSMLYVGRLVVEKGVDVLIKAAASTGIPVDIIGDGPLRGELEALASSLGAPVRFLGLVWGDGVEEAMLRADALVVPSVWHEVSPLVVYQAMSLGVPVVASDVGGLPDLLGDGRGVLVPGGDVDALATALRSMRDDRAGAATTAKLAREYSDAELSGEKFEERLVEVYAEAGVNL